MGRLWVAGIRGGMILENRKLLDNAIDEARNEISEKVRATASELLGRLPFDPEREKVPDDWPRHAFSAMGGFDTVMDTLVSFRAYCFGVGPSLTDEEEKEFGISRERVVSAYLEGLAVIRAFKWAG